MEDAFSPATSESIRTISPGNYIDFILKVDLKAQQEVMEKSLVLKWV